MATAIIALVIELCRVSDTIVPIPFLLLYASVVLSGGSAGTVAGATSGAVAAAYVVYASIIGFGPGTLTGGEGQVTLGVLLYVGTGMLLGRVHDQRNQYLKDVHRHEAELESEILVRTEHLRKTIESLRSFEQFVDTSKDLLEMIGLDHRYLAVNKEFCRFHGVTVDQAVGRHVDEFWGRHVYGARIKDRIESCLSGNSARVEAVIAHPTLGDRDFEIDIQPLLNATGDSIVGAFLSGRDVTERQTMDRALRESRTRLQSILDFAPFTVFIKDRDFRYVLVNRNIQMSLHLNESEFIGRTGDEIFPAEIAERLSQSDREVVDRGEPVSFQIEVAEPARRSFCAQHIIKFPIFDAAGDVTAIGGIVIDTTERTRLEAQLRQAQKMEAVGHLTGGVAHDFNNILTSVLGNLELAAQRVDHGDQVSSLIGAAARSASRGADLTQRLLAYARQQSLVPQVIDARALVDGMTGLLRRTLEESVDIEIVAEDKLWNCEVDPGQLENAILNLAINARDAMPGGGKLRIELKNADLDDPYLVTELEAVPGEYVMVTATDSGIGMPADVVERVFEPFFTTKDTGKGSGLGLSMVHGFVKQSNGHVRVESEEGVGTTISMYLPRSRREHAEIIPPDRGETPRGRGETVLVVEDNPDVLELFVKLLSDLEYDVMQASDGPSALSQLERSGRIDLLLTDVVLPGGMRGPDLAAEVKRRVPGVSVLFTSGYTDDTIIHHGRLDEGIELLAKPFRKVDLARKLRSTLDRAPS